MSAHDLSALPPDHFADAIRDAIETSLGGGRSRKPSPPTSPAKQLPLLPVRPKYTIAEFLQFHDEAFIVNAHVGLLQRKPDDAAIARGLKALRAGKTRLEMLREIRFSGEGQARNVPVLGLSKPDSAVRLDSQRKVIKSQLDAVWSKKVRRLKRQVRGLKDRLIDLERIVHAAAPTRSAATIEQVRRDWESRPNSQGVPGDPNIRAIPRTRAS